MCLLRGTSCLSKYSEVNFRNEEPTIPPAVSRRPLNGDVPVRFQVSPREICSGQVGLGQVFLRVLPFSPVSIIPFMLHAHFYRHVAVKRRTNGRNLGTFRKGSAVPSRAALDSKTVSLFSSYLKG